MTTPSYPNRATPEIATTVAVQIAFRNLPTSPAVAALIELEAQNLGRRFDKISHCHVVVASPHNHHRQDDRFSVHIELGVPDGPIVAMHEPGRLESARKSARTRSTAANDLYTLVRHTFAAAQRQLEHHFHRKRSRGKPQIEP